MLSGTGRVIHAGKTMMVASGEVLDAQGRQVVVATGTHMLTPTPLSY
jgi:acyl-coenzyme A thioesterase PaaI-like protein